MGEKHSVAYKLTAAAGSSDVVTLFTVTSARRFMLQKVTVHFPAGSNYQLEVKLLRGNEAVAPREGVLVGDDSLIVVESDAIYEGGQPVLLYYKNSDTANPHEAFILVEGEVM